MEHELHVSPREFSEIMEKQAELCRFNPDGPPESSLFEKWVIERFGIKAHNSYKVIIDWKARD